MYFNSAFWRQCCNSKREFCWLKVGNTVGYQERCLGSVSPLQKVPCVKAAVLPSPKTESGTELFPSTVVLTFSCIWNQPGSFKNIGAWAWTTETAMKLVHLGHRLSIGIFQNCPGDSNM